eukprot:9328863-Heterocapsa_arctica.AAC.1
MILRVVPSELKQGWRLIMRGFKNNDPDQREAEETADWIQIHGRAWASESLLPTSGPKLTAWPTTSRPSG